MKSLLVSLAFVLGGANAYAQVTATTLAKTVQTTVASARGVSVNPAIANRIALIAGASAVKQLSDATLTKLSSIVKDIETVAASNRDINGLSISMRLEALQLAFLAIEKNNGKEADVDKVVLGELYKRAIVEVPGQMDAKVYGKYIDFSMAYTNPDEVVSADDAARQATQGSLAAFTSACGGSTAADRRN